MSNDVKVKPEIEEISREKHKENLTREIESHKKNITGHEESLEKLQADRENIKKKYKIARADFKIINPTWEYEKKQEYLDCLLFDLEIKEWQDTNLFEQNELQIKRVIEQQQVAIDSLLDEQKRIDKDEKK